MPPQKRRYHHLVFRVQSPRKSGDLADRIRSLIAHHWVPLAIRCAACTKSLKNNLAMHNRPWPTTAQQREKSFVQLHHSRASISFTKYRVWFLLTSAHFRACHQQFCAPLPRCFAIHGKTRPLHANSQPRMDARYRPAVCPSIGLLSPLRTLLCLTASNASAGTAALSQYNTAVTHFS